MPLTACSHPRRAPLGRSLAFAALTGLLLVLATGCRSTDGGSRAFAAVTLHGHSPETIRQTAANVLAEKGYYDSSRGREWLFDRPTSTMSQVMYGGWFDKDTVRERVRLNLVRLGDDMYRLECTAVMVRDAGDAFFEEETRMTRLRSGPYEKILREVERRLPTPTTALPPSGE